MKPANPADPPTLISPGAPGSGEPDTLVREPEIDAPSTRQGVIVADDPTTVSGVYVFGEVIGRGGMGEVLVAHDRRIGRDVAVKRSRNASPTQDEAVQFLREARIQARLDHPAIVPVYELGRDQVGRPYFAMKRLSGTTLAEVMNRSVTRQRLLRAFAEVCRAVDFAHARGVVHRDLKPGNIVLGEYGEVYVLDWGAARVLGDAAGGVITADIDTLDAEAAPEGHVLGTPGYMAPEQLRLPEVGRAADVYSLGAILFELLAGEPLHPRAAPIPSTLSATTVTSPATRRPDRGIPPELDALCTAMLVLDPKLRPTARRCADGVEEFLDGDRDHERRRTMAIDLVWQARAAYDAGLRADAMRAASRALALDPGADGAAELVTHLMLEPPREPPPELREAVQRTDDEGVSTHARAVIPGYVLIAVFMPILVWNGVRHWPTVIAATAITLALALAAWRLVRVPRRSFLWMLIYGAANALLFAVLSRISGSLTFVCAVISFTTASVMSYPAFLRHRWVLIGLMLAAFLGPIGLEAAGAIPSTWALVDGGLLIRGYATSAEGASAIVVVVFAVVATIVMAGIQSSKQGRANRDAQHRLVVQAWHLRQLLPAPAR